MSKNSVNSMVLCLALWNDIRIKYNVENDTNFGRQSIIATGCYQTNTPWNQRTVLLTVFFFIIITCKLNEKDNKNSNSWIKHDTVFKADSKIVDSLEESKVATAFRAPQLNIASLCSTVSESNLHRHTAMIKYVTNWTISITAFTHMSLCKFNRL